MKTKVKLDVLYYDFGDTLITFFERIASEKNADFNISADSMVSGYISNGDICISYVVINENEMIYVYKDNQGLISFNTGNLGETFTKVGGNTYFGYEQLEDEPFNYINKVNQSLNEYTSEKKSSKQYHI